MKHGPIRVWQGWVRMEIEGRRPERLLNLAAESGLTLDDVRREGEGRLSVSLALADVERLSALCRDSCCLLHIRQRQGLPFIIAFFRRRPLLPLLLGLGLLVMFWCSSLVTEIIISSPQPLLPGEEEQVLAMAAKSGLVPWASRWLIDVEQAERDILAGMSQIFYAEVYVRGTAVEIAVVRRVDVPPDLLRPPAGDLVAACPGVIREVLVKRGSPAVLPGDTVQTGQILIYGWDGAAPVAASGQVTATVYGSGLGRAALEEEEEYLTGLAGERVSLSFPQGGRLVLAEKGEQDFPKSEIRQHSRPLLGWRNLNLPVEVVFSEICQVEVRTVRRSPAQARREAAKRARLEALAQIKITLPEADIRACQVLTWEEEGEPGNVTMRASASLLTTMGVFSPLSQEQAEAYLAQPPLPADAATENW